MLTFIKKFTIILFNYLIYFKLFPNFSFSYFREFELRLPRQEVEEVDCLRDKWCELLILADQVREVLLKERREAFEQELDKQVKVRHNIVSFL